MVFAEPGAFMFSAAPIAPMPQVGLVLVPDIVFLDLMTPVLADRTIDYFSVTPETMWRFDPCGRRLELNGFATAFESVAAGRPFVAHGVGLSLGRPQPLDRQQRLLDAIDRAHRRFAFSWYTDHLGTTVVGQRDLALPLPLPWDAEHAAWTRKHLADLAERVATVGVENSAFYFALDDPLEEPGFLATVTDAPHAHMLLDVHNLYTNAVNLGFCADAWLDRAPLDRVIEIHVSGGTLDPLGSGLRLDSHDAPVPDPVWSLLERAVARCCNLRGVTLERREGTVEAQDVPALESELHRIRRTIAAHWRPAAAATAVPASTAPSTAPSANPVTAQAWRKLADGLLDGHAIEVIKAEASEESSPEWSARWQRAQQAGLTVTAQMIVRLRFERLLSAHAGALAHFQREPAAFSQRFRRYHRSVPPTATFPQEEAALYDRFVETQADRRT